MEELNRLYNIYKKKYQEKEYREKKKYGALYKSPEGGMLNRGEFYNMFTIKKDELHNVKYNGTVVIKLVEEQFNERISNKQAKVYQKAIMEKTGKEFSLHQLKSGAYDNQFWDMVKERQNELRLSGYHGKGLAAIISMEFFGS